MTKYSEDWYEQRYLETAKRLAIAPEHLWCLIMIYAILITGEVTSEERPTSGASSEGPTTALRSPLPR